MKTKAKLLKVEIKSLAMKSRSLRQEIRRTSSLHLQSTLQMERLKVRQSLRCLHLAYGFIRGRSYAEIECAPKTMPSFDAVSQYVNDYGVCKDWDLAYGNVHEDYKSRKSEQDEHLMNWLEKAKAYFKDCVLTAA